MIKIRGDEMGLVLNYGTARTSCLRHDWQTSATQTAPVGRRTMKIVMRTVSIAACTCIMQAYAADPSRGELLYGTNCVACHTAQMHWRDQRLATDWKTLNVQVRRWQKAVRLDWNEQDIGAVASYLNQLYYEFPEPNPSQSLSGNGKVLR